MAATHVCSPYARVRFMERAEQASEYLSDAVRIAEESGLFTKERGGFDPKFAARVNEDLQRILPMSLDQFKDWAVSKGMYKLEDRLIKDVGVETVPAPNMALGPEEVGYVNALTKVYIEANAGGAKMLADAFLMKVKAGEDAMTEGLALAKQLQGMARFGSAILGMDQELGRGLRQSGLIRGSEAKPGIAELAAEARSGEFTPNATKVDALGNPGAFGDVFHEIASKLNDAATRKEGVDDLIRLASRIQFLDDPHMIGKAASAMELAGNAWTEVYMNGLLSNPGTVVTNLLGGVWAVARPMLQLAGATAWQAVASDGQWKEAAQLAATEASVHLAQMYSSLHDAVKLGWHAARTERALYQDIKNPWIHGEQLKATLIAGNQEGVVQAYPQVFEALTQVGGLVRLPSRAQIGMDEMIKHMTVRGQIAANAVRAASFQGVDLTDKAALQKFIDTEMQMAYHISPDALVGASKAEVDKAKAYIFKYNQQQPLMPVADQSRRYATTMTDNGQRVAVINRPLQAAEEAVFQEANGLADAVNGVISKYPFLRPFVPFVRTPLNIIRQGFVESTGLGPLIKGANIALHNPTNAVFMIQEELLRDPAQTARVAGQISLTTLLGASVYAGVMNGQITGGGPGRWTPGRNGKAAQDNWVAAGNVPYSIKVGDAVIPFDRFGEPLAITMRMMSDIAMFSGYMDGNEKDDLFAGVVGIMASGLYQASFLTGVESLVKVFQGDTNYAMGQAIQGYVATQTPFGGLLAYVDRVTDPYKSAYEGGTLTDMLRVTEDAFGTGIFGKLAARVPGLGQAPQLVDQLTGRPVPIVPGVGPGGINPLQMAIPIFPRNNKADAVWKAVWDISGSYIERRPRDMKLTAKEQQQLNQYMAESRVDGKTLGQRILEFRRRADVEQYVQNKGGTLQGVKSQIENELDAMISEHFNIARLLVQGRNEDVQRRARYVEARDVALQNNDVESARQLGGELEDLFQRSRRGY